MGTPRNIATLPVQLDMDAMFEALRPQIEALVSERVKAALEAREGAPEIMKPAAAARYLNISVSTLERRHRRAKFYRDGLPYYKRDDLIKI